MPPEGRFATPVPEQPGGSLPCPRCDRLVAPSLVSCPHCGVDLALAAVLAERQALSVLPVEPDAPFVGDAMLSRFGEFLMKKGYITEAQLEDALARQGEIARMGMRETLGQVLLEQRVMTREQLELASVEQVQELQNALRAANAQLEQRVAERTRELERAYRRLTELDRLKSDFISNVSHELRTPLTKIKGFHALLSAGELGPLTGEQEQAVEIMGRGVAELERLVGDLIQFATGAKGEMALSLAPFPAGPLVEGAVAAARARAETRGIALACRPIAAGLTVTGDVERLRWVMAQLLDNAIKFTQPGGSVEAGAKPVEGGVRFWVADTGTGISEERLPELFEPFHQLDGSATRKAGGTGLGLALVKMIVSAHGSTVSVVSRPGVGSRFSFDLGTSAEAAPDATADAGG
ncbi:MAG TPA: ATP-binding protein [Vicinamibacterales bacterium]|nr:ATP-binding protein [Vicinamibacterales bacterium]HPW21663.1 ATP-binding protein [Vicinamibacterales bacterium]